MANIDQKLTAAIQEWLNTPQESRDMAAGAEMLLKLNRNMAMYNSAMRRPEKYGDKVAYELRKYLNIRLRGMAVSDVVDLERRVMPRVAETLAEPAPDTVLPVDAEHPEAKVARGRRADHDSLPAEIQSLYTDNLDRRRRIDLLFNEIKAMSHMQPCDRFEKLHMLDETESEYRKAWAAYDSYVAGEPVPVPDAEVKKRLSAARKTISKYRSVYEKSDGDRREAAVAKVRDAAMTVLQLGGDFSDETRFALKEMGVSL